MGKVLLGLILFSGINANAGWTEHVGCLIERFNVDTQTIVTESVSANMWVTGPHNGEKGKVTIHSQLAKSYPIIYEKRYTGRNTMAKVTSTLYGNPVAITSGDLANGVYVVNRYMTTGGNYEMTVGCTTE